jgi:hypothetical protein
METDVAAFGPRPIVGDDIAIAFGTSQSDACKQTALRAF